MRARSPGACSRFSRIPTCPQSWCARTDRMKPRPSGTATFSTPRRKPAASTARKTSLHPGRLASTFRAGEAIWLAAAQGHESALGVGGAEAALATLRATERRRRATLGDRLDRAADAYLVRRGSGRTIVAGYPWFTDWGRDTFIALRGLCLATGRLEDAEGILLEWAGDRLAGHAAELFPGRVEPARVQRGRCVALVRRRRVRVLRGDGRRRARRFAVERREARRRAIEAILAGYAAGTRFGIRADADGLLAAGQPGVQLTWMDAKVGDWVVTPRIGKPVEVQALWLNALLDRRRVLGPVASSSTTAGSRPFTRVSGTRRRAASTTSWTRSRARDAPTRRFRPNQIFAVGGLPFALLEGERARRVVDAVEAQLSTPLGLRSLAPGGPGYAGRYEGGLRERDGAYHQGTVWPCLARAFRRRLGAGARRHGGGEARGARALPRAAHGAISTRRASATSPRSPTATRRTRRAAARSRPGRSGSCCGSTA